MSLSKGSIRKKLIHMSMVTSMLVVTLACMVFVFNNVYQARKSLIEELVLVVNITGNRLAPGLLWGDEELVHRSLETLSAKDSIISACIYDSENNLFTSYTKDGFVACSKDQSYGKWDYVSLYNSVEYDGEPIGSMHIISDYRDLKKKIPYYMLFAFIIFVTSIGLAWLMSIIYQRKIAEPIINLSRVTRRVMDENNYSLEAEIVSDDEMGLLADRFNRMLAKIRHRDAALQDANRTLELKVQERTKDLEKAKEKAEAASEAKSEFLRNMSHEFRTPLHGMLSFATFGIQDYETVERVELKGYFEKIVKVTKRLTELVDGVLNIARMESGAEQFLFDSYDLNTLITSVQQEQAALIEQSGLTLVWEPSSAPVTVVCDKGKLVQVITNFLGNAIKFTEKGKKIIIKLQDTEDEVMVSITDFGIGIPEGEEEDIFGKFVQSTRTKTEAGGTGLGLSICTGIVKGHGGRIWAKNNDEGEGATFSFVIPKGIEKGGRMIKIDDL